MSVQSKRLRRLGLPKDLLQRFHRNNVITCSDILSKSVIELLQLVNRGLPIVHDVVRVVSQASAPAPITALELWQKRKAARSGFFPTSLTNLDRVLHGGLLTGTITEVAGPSGCGKTQLCIMLSVQAGVVRGTDGQTRLTQGGGRGEGGLGGAVIYIDTESAFSAERKPSLVADESYLQPMLPIPGIGHHYSQNELMSSTFTLTGSTCGLLGHIFEKYGCHAVSLPDGYTTIVLQIIAENDNIELVEMARSHYPDLFSDEALLHELTSQVFIYREQTCQSLWARLESLEEDIILKGAKLVILDSVASLVRKEYSSNSGRGLTERTNFLAKEAALLKYLAETFNIPIVVTNQITTHFSSSLSIPEAGGEKACDTDSGGYVTTALGNTWSHSVNTRLILQYLNGPYRQILVAKSPISPFITFTYTIQDRGLVLVAMPRPSLTKLHPHLARVQIDGFLNSLTIYFKKTIQMMVHSIMKAQIRDCKRYEYDLPSHSDLGEQKIRV